MNPDGSNQVPLTAGPAADQDPAWSADGTKIVFSRSDGDFEIWVMDADGTDQRKTTSNGTNDTDPAWSPDGTKIAFTRRSDVWVMDADGTDQRNLTEPLGVGNDAAWSPDGTKIAFDTQGWIYVMNADGTNPTGLVVDDATNQLPTWSPDGSMIAFTRDEIGRHDDVAAVNADGSGLHHISGLMDGDFVDDPRWSPDGSAFVLDLNGQLQRMDADGTDMTSLNAAGTHPDWQPLASPSPCARSPVRPAMTSWWELRGTM